MASERSSGSAQPLLVLRKVSEILNCFSIEFPEPTLQQIVRQTGLPSSTCQRLVQNMVREGFLDRDGDRYRIGLRLVQWATPGTFGLDVVRLVHPFLQELRDKTGETACLYMRDGAFRTVVAVAETRHVVMRPFLVGQVMPMHAGAPGKIFLAFDPEAREAIQDTELTSYTSATPDTWEKLDSQVSEAKAAGFYAAFGERNSDVGSISAPVFNHAGRLAAVLGVGFPTQRVSPDDVGRLGPAVADAARAASAALGYLEKSPPS
ncbi:IclR family transcriptional regulator [Arthrobacter sp. FW306-05-C]|uniref:IclR family transcriptional regulator n=1 Tax=Arthrobacter TaxID=1663 RepID=UPI001EF01603|nr:MULTISPECIES: IclR family transcriptional regulator [Arthrobacter]MDP9987542.1 DNA-binding IclR family transcriptional regulator [Arthrobacter oryzae]UKA68609.1 IclR family transcriptional regulator [Arthrobacter sp. FW306-05-C]UKA77244.1 IclR family transcriptional regulator [Arthrobacter sp. FW306-07-I]